MLQGGAHACVPPAVAEAVWCDIQDAHHLLGGEGEDVERIQGEVVAEDEDDERICVMVGEGRGSEG
jgi:hypothetical protein